MICDFLACAATGKTAKPSSHGPKRITFVCVARRILTVFELHVDKHPSRCRLASPCQSTETYGFIGAPFVSLIELLCLFPSQSAAELSLGTYM